MCASDLEIRNIWILTVTIVPEKAQTVMLFNSSLLVRDSLGQKSYQTEAHGSVCVLFQHLWRENVCKPIIVQVVNLPMGMLLILQYKNRKTQEVTKQCNLWSQQTKPGAEGNARSLRRDRRPPFRENETKWQETINLYLFLSLPSLPQKKVKCHHLTEWIWWECLCLHALNQPDYRWLSDLIGFI